MSFTEKNFEYTDKSFGNPADSNGGFPASRIIQEQLDERRESRGGNKPHYQDVSQSKDFSPVLIALDPADSSVLKSKVYVRIDDNIDQLLARTDKAGSHLRLDREQYLDISKDLTYLGRKYGALEHVANYFNESMDSRGNAWKAVIVEPDSWLDKIFDTAPYIELVPGGYKLPNR